MSKRTLLAVHKYCGLVAALLILIQALTGITLVYRDNLGRLLDPAAMTRRTAGADLPPGMILQAAQQRFPDFEVRRLVFPTARDGVYSLWLADADQRMHYATLDPGDGALLSDGSIWRYPVEAALSLHYRLSGGKLGMLVVMMTGLSLLCLIVSGFIFWWPKGNKLGKALVVRRNLPARFFLRQLHRTVGVVGSLLLSIMALTGLIMLAAMLLDPPPSGPWPKGAQKLDQADSAFALAQARFPGYSVRDIRMPAPDRFNVLFRTGERNPEAVSSVSVDLTSLRVQRVQDVRRATDPLVLLLSIHDGTLFGMAGTVVIFILGLVLAFLAVTGPLGWYLVARRRSRTVAKGPARD
jgi:uncharacterized iron-regulated membrane protein